MNIELHIEELVLQGIGRRKEHEIRAAMERELATLLNGDGRYESMGQRGEISQLDAGSFQVNSKATGQMIGAQLAQSVYRGIQG